MSSDLFPPFTKASCVQGNYESIIWAQVADPPCGVSRIGTVALRTGRHFSKPWDLPGRVDQMPPSPQGREKGLVFSLNLTISSKAR